MFGKLFVLMFDVCMLLKST